MAVHNQQQGEVDILPEQGEGMHPEEDMFLGEEVDIPPEQGEEGSSLD